MKLAIDRLFIQILFLLGKKIPVGKGVDFSVTKYHKTYKLLEKYDQKAIRNPEVLADSGRLRPFIQKLQKKN